MTIEQLRLIRNIGKFDNVATGANLPLAKFALIYAENGRGKTTMSAVFRSLATGVATPILERHRLGTADPAHVIIRLSNGTNAIFQNGAWSTTVPDISVFDDDFVTANVHSGMQVDASHRQNLHDLIVGAQGVQLNNVLQAQVALVEQHNTRLGQLAAAIPASVRGRYTVDEFCALAPRDDLAEAIQAAERNLAAARNAEAVLRRPEFQAISLPVFDVPAIQDLLNRRLPGIQAEAALQVQRHLGRLGAGSERWVSEGIAFVAPASAGLGENHCPFCAQALAGSQLVGHYEAFFSQAYREHKARIATALTDNSQRHGPEILASFERSVRLASENAQFWQNYGEVPGVHVDTAAIVRSWRAAQEAIETALQRKLDAPLEAIEISREGLVAIEEFEIQRNEIAALSASLQEANDRIAVVKEQAAGANIAALESDLQTLAIIRSRHSEPMIQNCQAYLQEKAAKTVTEGLRDQARQALTQYREQVFPAYETAINTYLGRFGAGFRLSRVVSQNIRSGSSASYHVLIDQVDVPLVGGAAEPSFKNTLSAGDRNTLALAFFFASLERSPNLQDQIVVIDDPMTSLDENRTLTTRQELHRLVGSVEQVIVLSHSKPFLCELWESADVNRRSSMRIVRDNAGSTLADWDVNRDCITEHDKRHELVRQYLVSSVGINEREVATSLRPMLEAFCRVAYPEWFPPGTMLGQFVDRCRQALGTPQELLNRQDTTELRALLDYANNFHHDTNAAYQTAAIRDQELFDFATRTLAFARR
ncbi:AAA family ATPase [Mesorhizobium sp. B2-8-9]|uniref:AAA family ATPase n=1 Tax=Mesorhizobium sp. B2-8-9 TaxID=2589899 RepID=UPI00112606CC|nr:AAA family ATPase [Mesorhizobium sp. B2-8-9]TPI66762.1 hypothetical protein FJ423_32940 [Mesorhizobium sp. B2-8-9]